MAVADTDPYAARQMAIESLQRAAANAFITMADMSIEMGEVASEGMHGAGASPAETKHTSMKTLAGCIVWGGGWKGTGFLECSPEFACRLANAMLGTETVGMHEDALDALAEMTNIIFGCMKTELERNLGVTGLSTPTLMFGGDVTTNTADGTYTVIPLRVAGTQVWMKMNLERTG
jgi:CheY-specific phosphatase CheX